MREIIATSFQNVAPLFCVVFVGYALRRLHVLTEADAVPLNTLCFRLLLPCLCIRSMQTVAFDVSYLRLVLYILAAYAVTIPLLCLFVPRVIRDGRQAGVVIQGAYRSNDVLLGLPLMENIRGAAHMAPMMIAVTEVLLLYNFTAVAVLAHFSERQGARADFAAILKKVLRNPIIVGTLLGLALRLSPFSLPVLIEKPLGSLASCASTVAMIAIGLRFRFAALSGNQRAIWLGVSVKLLFGPLVWVTAAALLGFRGDLLCASFLVFACPTATASVALADAMGCDGDLAGELVLVSTALSLLTIFCGVVLLRALALI